MNIDSQVSLCSRQKFYCQYSGKSFLFLRKCWLYLSMREQINKRLAKVYSVAMLFFVKENSGRMSTPPSHAPGCYQSALIGLLDLLTFVRNTKSPIWPKGNCLCISYSFSAARHLLMRSVRSTLACSLIQCEIISEHGPCFCQ